MRILDVLILRRRNPNHISGDARQRRSCMPSGATRKNTCSCRMLHDAPLHTAEFLAVDTETNGLARERCELTEVGAVLVGGGELHDRWSSLVGVSAAAVARHPALHRHHPGDGRRGAPPPEAGAARARGAAARAACSSPTTRASTRACCARRSRAPALDWPAPPVLCTVAMARRLAPLQRRRGLASLADALGRRGRHHPPRAAGRGAVRAGVLRAVQAAVRQRADGRGGGGAAAGRQRPPRGGRARPSACSRVERRPDLRALTRGPGVYVFRDARRPAALRRQVGRRAQPGAFALHLRRRVDGAGRAGRLRGDGVRARRAAARAPADPQAQAAGERQGRPRARRPGLHPLPARHRVPDPRGRARAGGRARGLHRARPRPRRRRRARRAAELAVRAAPLRRASCRAATTRAPTGRWVAACRPASATWTRTSTASGSRARCGCSSTRATAGARCSATWRRRCTRPPRRASTSAPPRCGAAATRLDSLVFRLGGVLRAVHSGARLVVARHPSHAGPRRRPAGRRRQGRGLDGAPAAG